MNLYFKILLSLFISTFFVFTSVAQNDIEEEEEVIEESIFNTDYDTISIRQFADIIKSKNNESTLSDLIIRIELGDEKYKIDKVFFSIYSIDFSLTKSKEINIYNCKFELGNTPLYIQNLNFNKLNLVNTYLSSPIKFVNCSFDNSLIENCEFNNSLRFVSEEEPINNLRFINNSFKTNLDLKQSGGNLQFDKNHFLADNKTKDLIPDDETSFQLSIKNQNYEEIHFTNNSFNNNNISSLFSIDLSNTGIDNLVLISNSLQYLDLSNAGIEKSLLIDSLNVSKSIGILNFDFPEKNTNASWDNLGGEKLSAFERISSGEIVIHKAKTNNELSNTLIYNDLISSYNKFNSLYHDRGDINSANSSYVEIKDIETRRQAYIQTVKPSLNNLINYKLNVFLRFFSDYATNPGKSLIYSIYVILLFTLLFMLSFNSWDGMNIKFVRNQYGIFSEYITSGDSLRKIIEKHRAEREKNKNEINDIEQYYKICEATGKKIPRILRLFGSQIHFLSKIKFDIIPALSKFLNFQQQAWDKLSILQKVISGITIIGILFIFSLYFIIVKLFNSLILSLNNFVVIGFGAMPEQDNSFAMYLSIIEGIIGWFLLTIFTITLFSQVLQNA